MAFVVFAIASFAWGNIESDSVFCQLSGFALAIGIESSDIAVLLIALHSAMYIFRPRSGLYPYRQVAYLVFYLYPALAACLAFIKGNGYENMGHYCYLRTDRRWARLALSWVPRYFICASIVVIYVFIYLYIRRRMGDYGRRRSEAMQPQPGKGPASPPLSPRLCYNGLLLSAASSRRSSATDTITAAKDHQTPTSSMGLNRLGSARSSADVPQAGGPVKWNWPGFTQAQSSSGHARPSTDDACDPMSLDSSLLSPPPPAAHPPPPHPNPATDAPPAITTTPFSSFSSSSATPDMPSQQKKTARQLRSLFTYPLVYIVIWLFPFVSHILGYDDDSRAHAAAPPPHWLLIVSIISLSVQGAADCVVFLTREKPWRHAGGRGFLAALGKRWVWRWRRGVGGKGGVGRTREEVLVDGRLARERREGEVVDERGRGRLPMGTRMGKGEVREWWDVYGDGDMEEGLDDEWGREEGVVAVRRDVV